MTDDRGLEGMEDMKIWKSLGMAAVTAGIILGASIAQAKDRIKIDVVNDRPFILSLELRDMHCGGGVILREQLEAGEKRELEICVNADGLGALGATYGSGCSQVKRTDFRGIEEGTTLSF